MITVDSDVAVTFHGVVVHLQGWRKTPLDGSGVATQLLRTSVRVLSRCRLNPGDSRFPFRIDVPPGLPPSFAGRLTSIRYQLDALLKVPAWFDRTARVQPWVPVPTSGPIQAMPLRARTPSGDPPDLEVRLDSYVARLGGWLRGAVALSNVGAPASYTGIELLLRCRESASGSSATAILYQNTHVVAVSRPQEGTIVPFEIRLPGTNMPSYRDGGLTVAWSLRVTGLKRWQTDPMLEVPITAALADAEILPGASMPTLVGSERTYAWWNHAAQANGLHFDGSSLRGFVASTEIRIERHFASKGGFALVGTASYRALGLSLSIEPDTSWFSFGRTDIPLGIGGAWDRDHRVTGRERHQVVEFGSWMAPVLGAFERVVMDDDQLQIVERDSFESPDRINSFARRLVAFASGLAQTRPALPPPAAMAGHVDAWRALAGELDASFEPAAMSIDATVAGTPVRIWTALSPTGQPTATKIRLTPPGGIENTSPRIDEACGDVVSMSLDERQLIVAYPAPHPDPLRLAGRVRLLQQVLAAKDTPFR